MSLSKRWLETLPEFDVDVGVDVDIILEESIDEDMDCWPQWFEGFYDEYCIEADYEFIRRGC